MIDSATVLAENERHLISLDMEMPEDLCNKLLTYAVKNMSEKQLEKIKMEWAAEELLKQFEADLKGMSEQQKSHYITNLMKD